MRETDPPPMSLEELDAFLLSERAPDDAMVLPELDGFVTALVVGPVLIPPSEWLPHVWGEEAPVFEDEGELKRVIGAIFGLYNHVATVLAEEPEAFEPLFFENPETGEVFAADWAEGFLAGVALRSQAWQALLDSEDAHLLLPIAVFLADDEAGLAPLLRSDGGELRRSAPKLIPLVVPRIREFFRALEKASPRRARPGRNDPCPCGSGSKFKRCCGAGD
jgi:uncharacterized protein